MVVRESVTLSASYSVSETVYLLSVTLTSE